MSADKTQTPRTDAFMRPGMSQKPGIVALRDFAKTLEAENQCDACAGTGQPVSGKPCMCGGTGRMSDAARYLREQLQLALSQRDAAREAAEGLVPHVNWHRAGCDSLLHSAKSCTCGLSTALAAVAKLKENNGAERP